MSLKLLKQKDFTLLVSGKLFSLLGSNMLQFALSLYVLSLTGSATLFASILSITIFPRLLFSPLAGVFGDWFDRKKSIVVLNLINSLIIGGFALIYSLEGGISIPLIYILVVLLEITEIFFHSAIAAVLPSIVNKEDYLQANSLNSAVMNIGNILSPIIAALLYGAYGMKIILTVTSITFLLSTAIKTFISMPKSHSQPDKISIKAFKRDFSEGINRIKITCSLSTMIGLGTIINFSVSPLFGIVIIYYLKEILLVTDLQFGIFQMLFSLSMVAAPVFCGGIIKKINIGSFIYKGFLIISFLILAMALFTTSYLSRAFNTHMVSYGGLITLSFMVGLVVTLVNIALGTLFDKSVPLNMMGRTSTVFSFAVTVFIPLGQMLAGLLLDVAFTSLVVALSGLILFVTIIRYKKALLNYDIITDKDAESCQHKEVL